MPDFKEIARILVDRQMRIQENEVVKVSGGLHNLELIEEIAVQIRKNGAIPMVSIGWESILRRLINDAPDSCLKIPPRYRVDIENLIDCRISLPMVPDERSAARMNPEKIRLVSKALRCVQEASSRKGYRRIGIGFPTPEEADSYGLPFDEYSETFWGAVNADIDQVSELCHSVRERLRGQNARVVSPGGEELTFSIANRRINMDDGIISDEDIATGDITANLPFGEVYLAPVEETVNGVVVFPVVFHQGVKIENLRLVFRDGEMVESSAETNHQLFVDTMATYTGDKNKIGELGIGTNHMVHEPTGNITLDEKIYGSIHLALGNNTNYGGTNTSSCHWDMVVLQPTVYIDGKPLLKDGEFTL